MFPIEVFIYFDAKVFNVNSRVKSLPINYKSLSKTKL